VVSTRPDGPRSDPEHGTEGEPAGDTVRFSPGARSAWPSHALGQTLYVTDGLGLVPTRGEAAVQIRAGDIVSTPADEVHWHGAMPDRFMIHLSITEGVSDRDKPDTDWGAHVTDDEYHGRQERTRSLGAMSVVYSSPFLPGVQNGFTAMAERAGHPRSSTR
jgi:quercetin dioxygenase-like cupin family protein